MKFKFKIRHSREQDKEKDFFVKKDILWRVLGGRNYILPEIYINLVTVWLMGEWLNQRIVLAICIGQLLYVISIAGGSPLHLNDAGVNYSFAEILVYRMQTWFFALFIAFIYILYAGYDIETSYIVFLMILYRLIDALAEIFEVEFRLQGKEDLSSRAILYREIFSLIAYTLALIIERDLLIACMAAVIAKLPAIIISDILPAGKMRCLDWRNRHDKVSLLRKQAVPLFIIEFVNTYILYAVRVTIGIQLDGRDLTYYQEIFLLSQVVTLLSLGILQNPIKKIHYFCSHEKYTCVKKLLKPICLRLLAITAAVCVVMGLKGPVIIEAIYGSYLYCYNEIFVILSIGVGLSVLVSAWMVILSWMKKNVLWIFCFTGVCAVILNIYMVQNLGIYGGAIAFTAEMALCVIGLSVLLIRSCKK